MTKNDIKTFLTIITTLMVPILSLGIISPLIKIMFILIYICICFMLFNRWFERILKIRNIVISIAIVIEIFFIISSTINIGSISGYLDRIRKFFVNSQEVSNDFSEQISKINKKIENNNVNIEELNNDFNTFIDNSNNICSTDNMDQVEIDQIVKLIDKKYIEYNDYFPNLRNDIYSLELFYKLCISEKAYYYCNIIKAFEIFGADIEKLEENDLFKWDIEVLYITYNMYKQNYNNICLDENANGDIAYYSDYRVLMQRYSDTFDYSTWSRDYTDYTVKEAEEKLNNIIMNYYKKLIMNFSTE